MTAIPGAKRNLRGEKLRGLRPKVFKSVFLPKSLSRIIIEAHTVDRNGFGGNEILLICVYRFSSAGQPFLFCPQMIADERG